MMVRIRSDGCAAGPALSSCRGRLILGVFASFSAAASASWGQTTTAAQTQPAEQAAQTTAPAESPAKFKKLSLEELMDVEVTSVSRRESTVGDSPAAVYVITQDDIHRSGVTSIPEALRMAPGLQVQRADSGTWSIMSRGVGANKLLVLIDGRSVYTPLGGTVNWDEQDTMMEDIDRIEVIRGPAGALWGANAVNGVINIITKSAKDTQGLLVTGGGGTFERAFGGVRYGWKVGDDAYARVYAKAFNRGDTDFHDGSSGRDDWKMTRGGFRFDWQPSSDDQFTFHGDLYGGEKSNRLNVSTPIPPAFSKTFTGDTELFGGNFLGLWSHKLAGGSDMTLQMYYDRTDRDIPQTFKENRDTFDVDFQHHIPWGERQEITWGLGYRLTSNQIRNSFTVALKPDHRALEVFSAFVQDEIQLVKDKLRFTIGSKFEHNDFTGFEVQPNARLLWKIDEKQVAWASVSRAVRTPTQVEEDLQVNFPIPQVPNALSSFRGNRDFKAEDVVAYELGYRVEPVQRLAVDVAAFYNVYDNLLSTERGTSSNPLVIPFTFGNKLDAETHGVELGSTWKAADWWTLRAAYTYLQERLHTDTGSTDSLSVAAAGTVPHNQVYVRSSMDLGAHVKFDLSARYVESLLSHSPPAPDRSVPSYIAVDARLAWQPTEKLELAVVGQNLFDNRHAEALGATTATTHEIPRGVYGVVTYRW